MTTKFRDLVKVCSFPEGTEHLQHLFFCFAEQLDDELSRKMREQIDQLFNLHTELKRQIDNLSHDVQDYLNK